MKVLLFVRLLYPSSKKTTVEIKDRFFDKADFTLDDVTNYNFEIDKQDDFLKKGYSKEHKPNPIIQMGLAVDRQGIPISYRLFEGNTMTLKPQYLSVILFTWLFQWFS